VYPQALSFREGWMLDDGRRNVPGFWVSSFIHSRGGEVCNATFSPALSSFSEENTSPFWESYIVASYFRNYMHQFTSIYGRRKF
jgi:hypothetical protein